MEAKRRSARFWLDQVRAWRASGLTQVRYCAREGVSVHSLRYWVTRGKSALESKLKWVPVQVPLGNVQSGCVVRGPNGVAIAFGEVPPANYLSLLLGVKL